MRKEGLVIETKGCDSGRVGSAPVLAVCFQWNLGEVTHSLPLTQNLWLFLSFLLSEGILVTSCAFVCLPHHRCPLMQAGQPAFPHLGRRVQAWEFWGPFLERRMWSHAQICYQDSCWLFHLSPSSLPSNTSFSPPSLLHRSEVERKRRASFPPLHCEAKIYYYQSPLNHTWEQDYSNRCQLSTSYAVLQVAD